MEIGVLYLSHAMLVQAELIVWSTRGFACILAKWFWPIVMSLSLTYGSPEVLMLYLLKVLLSCSLALWMQGRLIFLFGLNSSSVTSVVRSFLLLCCSFISSVVSWNFRVGKNQVAQKKLL